MLCIGTGMSSILHYFQHRTPEQYTLKGTSRNITTMVFFSCDLCAEMLKKSKVDAHANRCGCESVSCVDCGVSFWGGEFNFLYS